MSVAFEIGRIVVKTAGRETARKGVLLGFIDKNFVLITGANLSGVRRRKSNLKHLVPTDKKIDISENASDEDVVKALDQSDLKDSFSEEFQFGID
ncbi:MAG: 50S ribosomal protein L14e [Candidatus Hodarchaeales archaeon]|jgi:large subunit ribosomal protein L14e